MTGSKNSQTSYQKVFEKYNFEYDSDSIREILVSANPDVVILWGLMIRDMTGGMQEKLQCSSQLI